MSDSNSPNSSGQKKGPGFLGLSMGISIGVGIAVVLCCCVVIFVVAGSSQSGSSGSSSSDSGTAEDSSSQAEIVVESVDISAFVKEFDDNQLAAERKYEGKTIQFTGFIDNISEDFLGDEYVSINPTNEEYYFGTYIQCFYKDSDQLLDLTNGGQVEVQGKVDTQSLGTIILKDCSTQ